MNSTFPSIEMAWTRMLIASEWYFIVSYCLSVFSEGASGFGYLFLLSRWFFRMCRGIYTDNIRQLSVHLSSHLIKFSRNRLQKCEAMHFFEMRHEKRYLQYMWTAWGLGEIVPIHSLTRIFAVRRSSIQAHRKPRHKSTDLGRVKRWACAFERSKSKNTLSTVEA